MATKLISHEVQAVRGEAVAYYDQQQRKWRFSTVEAATISRQNETLVLSDNTFWTTLPGTTQFTRVSSDAKKPDLLWPADFVNGSLGRYHGETDPTPRRKETSDPAAEGFAAAKRENATAPARQYGGFDTAYVEALENLLREARRQLYDAQKARIKSEALIDQINQLFGN